MQQGQIKCRRSRVSMSVNVQSAFRERFADNFRIRFAPARLHDLADEEPERGLFAGAELGHRIGVARP